MGTKGKRVHTKATITEHIDFLFAGVHTEKYTNLSFGLFPIETNEVYQAIPIVFTALFFKIKHLHLVYG
jgi:hypothetical protein